MIRVRVRIFNIFLSTAIPPRYSTHLSLCELFMKEVDLPDRPERILLSLIPFYHSGLIEQMKVLADDTSRWNKSNFFRIWAAAKQFDPDLILTGTQNIPEALAVGQKLRTPVVAACTAPFFPTTQWPPARTMAGPLPLGILNSFAHWAAFKGILSNNPHRTSLMNIYQPVGPFWAMK